MILPTVVVGRVAYGWRNNQLDDAMIYLRYTRNFRQGHGLVYNPGDRFNGLTSPLYSYVMAAGSLFTTHWQLLMIAVATVALLGAAIMFGKVFGQNRWESTFIAVAMGSVSYFYSTFGMETSMFLLMVAVTLYTCRVRTDYVLVAAAVLIGTRPEGVFLAVPAVVDYLWHHRRLPRWLPTALAFTLFALPFVVNLTYYGHLLPATSGAKIGQGRSGYWGESDAFLQVAYLRHWFFSGSKMAVVLLAVLAAGGAVVCRRDHVALVAVAFGVSLAAFYWRLNLPNYHWYYAPFFAFTVVFACKAIWRMATPAFALARARAWHPRALFLALPVALTIFIGVNVVTLSGWGHNTTYEEIGVWIRENTSPDATVGAVEIGNIGWYSERPIVDLLGLVNDKNADFIANRDVYGWLTVNQPDFIVRFNRPTRWEAGVVLLQERGAYDVFATFPSHQLLAKTGAVSDAEIAAIMNEQRQSANDS